MITATNNLLTYLDRLYSGLIRRKQKLYYMLRLRFIGKNCHLCKDIKITNPSDVSIGDNVIINDGVILQASYGAKIEIENNVTLSYRSMVLTGGRERIDGKVSQKHETASVYIKQGVWVGANAVILPGVTIGRNSIVAAGSVVNRDVSDSVIVGGVPGKMIKKL